jgi:hypothetical protein
MKSSQENDQPLKDKNKSKVIEIKTNTRRQDVVDHLTSWLKMAESGELIGVAAIGILKGNESEWLYVGAVTDDVPRTLGNLVLFQHEITCQIAGELEDIDPPDPTG